MHHAVTCAGPQPAAFSPCWWLLAQEPQALVPTGSAASEQRWPSAAAQAGDTAPALLGGTTICSTCSASCSASTGLIHGLIGLRLSATQFSLLT